MWRRARVYIAGPISNGGTAPPECQEACLEEALEVATGLLQAGYAPLVPHLTVYWARRHPVPYDAWLAVDEAWLACADCVLVMPGWEDSPGARREVAYAQELGLPVYTSVEALRQHEQASVRTDFERVLVEMGRLHRQKAQGYGTPDDPYYNVRASQEWGIPPWVGALLRATDKVRRLQSYYRRGEWAYEPWQDNLLDLAVYAVIAVVMARQATGGDGDAPHHRGRAL